jgi:hypothetical protein
MSGIINFFKAANFPEDQVLNAFNAGCVALTGMQLNKQTGKFPELRRCFLSNAKTGKLKASQFKTAMDNAIRLQKDMNDRDVCKCERNLKSRARIFAIQFETGGKTLEQMNIAKNAGDVYDLRSPEAQREIENKPEGKTNFDFLFHSEPGDTWYQEGFPWLHATGGEGRGQQMDIKLSDDQSRQEQYDAPDQYDIEFICVACSRCL